MCSSVEQNKQLLSSVIFNVELLNWRFIFDTMTHVGMCVDVRWNIKNLHNTNKVLDIKMIEMATEEDKRKSTIYVRRYKNIRYLSLNSQIPSTKHNSEPDDHFEITLCNKLKSKWMDNIKNILFSRRNILTHTHTQGPFTKKSSFIHGMVSILILHPVTSLRVVLTKQRFRGNQLPKLIFENLKPIADSISCLFSLDLRGANRWKF